MRADYLPEEIDPVTRHLRAIGRVPLLTLEEERLYTRQVYDMMQILDARSLGSDEAIAAHLGIDLLELKRRIKIGQYAKQKMIAANLRLVVTIAKKYQHRGVDFIDLIQEGSLGLNRAVEKFNPNKGFKFSTYAYAWIRQGITRAIANDSRTVRLPIHMTEKLNSVKKAVRELSLGLGRTPVPSEVAEKMGLSLARLDELRQAAAPTVSLNVKTGWGEEDELGEFIAFTRSDAEDFSDQEQRAEALNAVIKTLTPREQQVIRLRFGLEDGTPHTLASAGKVLGISREGVRQNYQRGMRKLRASSRRSELRELL